MRKSILFTTVFSLLLLASHAQSFKIQENSYQKVRMTFETPSLQTENVKIGGGEYTRLNLEGYGHSQTVGSPQLPVFTGMLEIPLCDSIIVNVVGGDYVEMGSAELGVERPVVPVQPSYAKSYGGDRPFVKDEGVYGTDGFYALPLAAAEKAGVMRDVNLAGIRFSPISYNPVSGRFRIYKTVEVEVTYRNADIPGTLEMKARYGSPLFPVAENAVLNPMGHTRDEFSGAPIKYLIIANSMFANNESLNQFINWKKRLGYIVEVAYTSDPNVGTTTTSIKNYILTHYNNATAENPAPTFLLLIGDVAQLPPYSCNTQNSHVSDLYYATWTDGDNIPDCYYGRFSAQNVSQLQPQIEKTLIYEQYTMEDPSYLGNSVLIAGTDSYYGQTHGDGQVNYAYNNYVNTNSTANNYTTVYKHNYNCSGQAATIRSEVGAGAGWTNYTAHGGETGWSDPAFENSHVSAMNNAGKYGVMIGNCCLTGKFNYSSDCFGETLLRTANKGAVIYVGASEVSYWDEDYYWAVGVRSSCTASPTYNASNLGAYDRIFHTHGESAGNWTSTIGALVQSGNMSVQSSSSDIKLYYWEIYHIFGDPSIRPYMGIPTQINVTSSDVIMTGAASYNVSTDAPYAYVAITSNNSLVCAAFADGNGNATLTLPASMTPGEYELAIGAQNKIQYFKTVNVIVPQGPYVVSTDVAASASSTPEAGSIVNWDLTVQNLGVSAANNAYAKMTTTAPGVTVLTDSVFIGNLAADATRNLGNAFQTRFAEDIEDGTPVSLAVTVFWGASSSTRNMTVTVNAPSLMVANCTMANADHSTTFSPGDLVTVTVSNVNAGHATLSDAIVDLTCNYTGTHVTTSASHIHNLAQGQTADKSFSVQVAGHVPDLTEIPLYYHRIYNNRHEIDTLYLNIGTAMETFESGGFSQFPWVTTGSNAWEITTTTPYAGSYSARSKSGLGNYATSSLQIPLNPYRLPKR